MFAGCRTNGAGRLDDVPPRPAKISSARTEAAPDAGMARAATPESPAVRARMHDHDKHGAALRDAIARADLDAARREAKVLSDLRIEGPIDPTWRRRLDAMNAAASRLVEAKDLGQASLRLSDLARTCGDCHATLGGPGPIVGTPPAEASGAVPRMKRHYWAAARLWEGLVVPSDDAWKVGASVLADAPLEPEALTPGMTPVPKVGALARSVRDVAKKASGATSPADRATAYAEVISSCSTCHQWLGGGPSSSTERP